MVPQRMRQTHRSRNTLFHYHFARVLFEVDDPPQTTSTLIESEGECVVERGIPSPGCGECAPKKDGGCVGVTKTVFRVLTFW